MSDFDWENDDFEPPSVEEVNKQNSRWSDEEESESEAESSPKNTDGSHQAPVVIKKKRTLKQVLKEKEEKKKQEIEKILEKEVFVDPIEEKLRKQKLVEDSDFQNAKDLFGEIPPSSTDSKNYSTNNEETNSFYNFQPETVSDFEEFSKQLITKFRSLENNVNYSLFLESFIRDVSISLPVEDMKKVAGILNVTANEKQKLQKNSTKGGKKKTQKATLKMNHDAIHAEDDYDEMEDFM